MTIRVGINGFGRIGRNLFRAAKQSGADIDFVAVNDLGSVDTMAHLLKYDSVLGRLDYDIQVVGDGIKVEGDTLKVLAVRDPKELPWGDLGVDVVVESTGIFTSRDKAAAHLDAGVPMVKVLDDAFGVERGLMTTVHAYTGDQMLVDGLHKDLRRARAAAINIVPTSTGAARATGLVLEAMQGRLDGQSLRVPVPDGSLTDFTGVLARDVTADDVNGAFKAAAESGPLAAVVDYSDAPLVSSDIVGSPASCTFDSKLTQAIGNLVKVFGWYDNEWGYSYRLVDLVQTVGAANQG